MDAYDTVAIIIDSNDGEIRGRTAVQKLTYFTKILIPTISIPPYRPHYYGPYSRELSVALEKMVCFSFLDELRVPGFMYDGYLYKLTHDGSELVDRTKAENKKESQQIKKIIEKCKEFCELRATPLSYAAKVYYLLSSKPPKQKTMTIDEAVKKAEEFGWLILKKDVEKGVQLLEQLNLVQISK